MSYKPIGLFNAYDLQPDPYEESDPGIQEVVYYCEARFRVAILAIASSPKVDQSWMLRFLFHELVLLLYYHCN
jgi:hypothetical protein